MSPSDNRVRVSRQLSMGEKRIYAKANEALRVGLYGQDMSKVFAVHLTSWSECRNTWPEIVSDRRNFLQALKRRGYHSSSNFCPELSPKNGLIHLHGFMRFHESFDYDDVDNIIHEKWLSCHGASEVKVQPLWSLAGAIKYCVKHQLKVYVEAKGVKMRMLISRDWYPAGWTRVKYYTEDGQEKIFPGGIRREFKRWGYLHSGPDSLLDGSRSLGLQADGSFIAFADGKEGESTDEFIERYCSTHDGYVYRAWDIVRHDIERWCNGEDILYDYGSYQVLISGSRIIVC